MLLEKGFRDVKEMDGGFTAWQKAGYPVFRTLSEGPVSTPPAYRLRLGLGIGDTAIDFSLRDLNGVKVSLAELLADKPVMLQFGSYT